MAQTVIGIFKDSAEAQDARQHLLKNGFSDDRIDLAAQSATNYSGDTTRTDQDEDFGDRVSKFFKNLFGDEDEATSYSRAASHGTVVTVHAMDEQEAERAADILDDYGAVDVNEYAASYGNSMGQTTSGTTTSSEMDRMGGMNSGRAGVTGTSGMGSDSVSGMSNNPDTDMRSTNMDSDITSRSMDSDMTNRNVDSDITNNRGMDSDITNRSMDSDITNRAMDSDTPNRSMDSDLTNSNIDSDRNEDTSIPIIEENINVGKKEVITGGKRIRSRIVERPVEETIRLREEHVNVERNPVDRAATDQDISNFKEGTIEVTEHKEVPVVDKESRIVEEVNVFKDVDETQEVVRETLRNTEVDTDDLTASNDRRDTDDLTDHEHDKLRDEIHRQRPGII